MRVQTLVLAAITAAAVASPAMADERINLTPPLYREQARATAAVRPASELTTTPTLTGTAPAAERVVVEATASIR